MSTDLSTRYLGLPLAGPLVVSACPLTERLDVLKRMVDDGASAAVMPSLFEEQVEHDEREIARLYELGADSFSEAASYFPELADYNAGPDEYLRRLSAAKQAVDVPIIGSLNGASPGGWCRYAKQIEDAGADALELNIYYIAADDQMTAVDVENRYLDVVHEVRVRTALPLSVKIGPYFTSLGNFAHRLAGAGADGLTLFNRFLQPDFDLETMTVRPHLSFSTPSELRLPLRWIAILRGRVQASLAGTGGVHEAADALKLLLAGADVVMIASSLYQKGPAQFAQLLDGIRAWMIEKNYTSVDELRGSMSQQHCPDPAAFERSNYMKALSSFTSELP
jgi:dihydroorotate dehydrogenase (fumarate)